MFLFTKARRASVLGVDAADTVSLNCLRDTKSRRGVLPLYGCDGRRMQDASMPVVIFMLVTLLLLEWFLVLNPYPLLDVVTPSVTADERAAITSDLELLLNDSDFADSFSHKIILADIRDGGYATLNWKYGAVSLLAPLLENAVIISKIFTNEALRDEVKGAGDETGEFSWRAFMRSYEKEFEPISITSVSDVLFWASVEDAICGDGSISDIYVKHLADCAGYYAFFMFVIVCVQYSLSFFLLRIIPCPWVYRFWVWVSLSGKRGAKWVF